MKIAIYKDLNFDFEQIVEATDYRESDDCGDVRLTEIIEVDFQPVKDDNLVKKQVDHIDNKINQVMAVAEAKITELKAKKAELLAITDQSGDL